MKFFLILIFPLVLFAQEKLFVDELRPNGTAQVSVLSNFVVQDQTTLNTSLNGFLKASSGVVSAQALIDLTSDVTGVLPIASGGTNSSTALTNNKVMVSDTGSIKELPAGTDGQFLSQIAGVPTWASVPTGSPTTTLGDLIRNDGGGAASDERLPIGTNGQLLTVVSGEPEWADAPTESISSITNKIANYTALTTDDVITCDGSGGSFTVTIYTAVGNTGRVLEIQKTDSVYTNPITIDGNGAETIGGNATTTLNTKDEKVKIVSDGANWVLLSRDIPQYSASYTPTWSATVNATPSGRWTRDRKYIIIDFLGTFTGANVQNVNLNFSIPTGLTIDSSLLASTGGTGLDSYVAFADAFSGTYEGTAVYNSATMIVPKFQAIFGTVIYSQVFNPSSALPATPAANDELRVHVRVPIVQWNE